MLQQMRYYFTHISNVKHMGECGCGDGHHADIPMVGHIAAVLLINNNIDNYHHNIIYIQHEVILYI